MRKHWELIKKIGQENVAWVYLLGSKIEKGIFIECVDAYDPRYSARQKWVVILSSQKGCPVKCRFCDASFYFRGNLSPEEILEQLDIVLEPHKNGDDCLRSEKIKLHFARMGEPALNPAVLEVLSEIPSIYPEINFFPTVATVAPVGTEEWFEKLIDIKNAHYSGGRFQLQFSVNSTDEDFRDYLMPVKKWSAQQISQYGHSFFRPGDRKVTLNYALSEDTPFEAEKILGTFDPEVFLVKITPVNPTYQAARAGLQSELKFDGSYSERLARELDKLQSRGYEVIISIGSLEEIRVGSNCGQLAFYEVKAMENKKYDQDPANKAI